MDASTASGPAGIDLDSPEVARALEDDGMLALARSLPDQVLTGWESGIAVELPPGYSNPSSFVVAGVGGSAMGADLVGGITRQSLSVPLVVSRDYTLPGFVGPDSLVVCSSYSGGTEETLSAFRQAERAGARIVLLGSGGELFESGASYPKIRLRTRGMPRAAVGESAMALLGLLDRLGLISGLDGDLDVITWSSRLVIRALDVHVAEPNNPAKSLARRLHGRMPVVIGVGHLGPVARRWKGQFNENPDQFAFWDELPEFNHNSIQGLNLPPVARESLHAVFLLPAGRHARTVRQGRVAAGLLERSGIAVSVLDIEGDSLLEQVMTAIVWGDFVSLYLAALNGVRPTPIDNIGLLKREMARGETA
ncbi:MAG: bifunctional phosphoglucose/phosphomannose isomerase [Chloroflexi bacterium]|nr:bifunctional phosphoglucose/phosphomannose isomerase [Chloroflexota bacterium]